MWCNKMIFLGHMPDLFPDPAAEWAVKKKKQHHSVSNRAFNAIEESQQRAIESSAGR
jgi:hypothetical protein